MKLCLIALGGNALLRKNEDETFENQIRNAKRYFNEIKFLFKKYNIILVHGSGPQAGSHLLKEELSNKKIKQHQLFLLDADIEGELGFILGQAIQETVKKRVVTLVTRVLVSKNDKAFKNPSKPVGKFYSFKEAEKLRKKGFKIVNDAGRGYRRVVASPKPIKIMEAETIRDLVAKGNVVISCGGGGIPVYYKNKKLIGIDAVIDKDLAASCLGLSVKAELFVILTDVDAVYLNYTDKNRKRINKMNVKEAKMYMKEGHFKEGSMKPKIQAAIEFLKKGKKVIITNPKNLRKALNHKAGTIITK